MVNCEFPVIFSAILTGVIIPPEDILLTERDYSFIRYIYKGYKADNSGKPEGNRGGAKDLAVTFHLLSLSFKNHYYSPAGIAKLQRFISAV